MTNSLTSDQSASQAVDDLPSFQQKQFEFTAHIRDPGAAPRPDNIEDRRMAIYRDLFFNNVNSFLENGFPVLHSLYREEAWLKLARSFFATHRSHSPYFVDISQEFIHFLQNEYTPTPEDPDFLLELAHYEWIELVLMTSRDEISFEGIDRNGDLLTNVPIASPLAECLSYQWPVHTISTDNRPEQLPEQPSHIIVYRNDEEDVKFIEANAVTARLMQLIQANQEQEQPMAGLELIQQIAEELQHPNPEIVIQGGHQTLTRWHHLKVILGVWQK